MISGFFLFPIGDERKFYKKRFTRVVIPFAVWCVVYAFYYHAQGTNSLRATLLNISHIPLNYGTEVDHLWFVYMPMAIYLIAPVLSPWIISASRKSMELFLLLWDMTLFLPFIHLLSQRCGASAIGNQRQPSATSQASSAMSYLPFISSGFSWCLRYV